MESSPFSIETLVKKVREEIFSTFDDYNSFVSVSVYDTAWLAMIPENPNKFEQCCGPMFKGCLEWVLNNQKEEGFWGERDMNGLPTIDSLPSTLACIVALKKWNLGDTNINKGLAFVRENSKMLLKERRHSLPCWFAIVFPAMVELAQATGLGVVDEVKGVLSDVLLKRLQFFETEGDVNDYQYYPPLPSFLEALPSTCDVDREIILKSLNKDGSLFQSPSATAYAFMATGERKCKEYLERLVRRCPRGVPPMYPMDEELIKLSLVNQVTRLGLAEHFSGEIEVILSEAYRSYKRTQTSVGNLKPAKLYKDSLAFRLLRMHGYDITSWSFCWFVYDEDILAHIERNSGYFMSALLNIYRATDLMFSGENELKEARSFARKLLEKNMSVAIEQVEHELSLPWIARLDHLDHRFWIEANDHVDALWIAKASFYRLSCLHNDKLMKLAVENYKLRQSIYQRELEEVTRWSKEWGLSELGFGREKTTYCYFAVAACSSLPHGSVVRLIVAKSAILITVADDFFDMKGSLGDLQSLNEAVQRWDGKGLCGHGKIIFEALDGLVTDIAKKHLRQQGSDITDNLRDIWRETFGSWLVETTWSNNGYIPSMGEYLETGMISIASHTIVLPASCFLNPNLPNHKLKPSQYEPITKSLMTSSRLLNDIQSYQKEQLDGKTNLVLLHLKGNPKAEIEDSISYAKGMLDEKKTELLEHALMDYGSNDLPKPCKLLHLSCLKVFQMFFNSSNRFDSDTELFHDIKRGIYIPPENPVPRRIPSPSKTETKCSKVKARLIGESEYQGSRNFNTGQNFARSATRIPVRRDKVIIPPKFGLCFPATKDFQWTAGVRGNFGKAFLLGWGY
ncbi:(E,E)-geranyllinalool synthase-like [Rhododendron vialii]|uniref:(E,E)-geranyllinalool synthase-like n=1 Tax=Rhododendron vialii TaxID=182163 RepID=UPI00265EAC42|nr:(E,E)-geranyllinalool synthase-like [Rhododendron vialii]